MALHRFGGIERWVTVYASYPVFCRPIECSRHRAKADRGAREGIATNGCPVSREVATSLKNRLQNINDKNLVN